MSWIFTPIHGLTLQFCYTEINIRDQNMDTSADAVLFNMKIKWEQLSYLMAK